MISLEIVLLLIFYSNSFVDLKKFGLGYIDVSGDHRIVLIQLFICQLL